MQLNNRRVVDIEVDYGREVEDTFIIAAAWDDTGEALTDAELEALQEENADRLYAAWFEHQVDRAEFYRDCMEDR